MRKIFKFTIPVALITLCFLHVSFAANPVQEIPNTFELAFPDIEGWEKGELVKYPRKEMGYGINYESKEGGKISIYVYDAGRRKIPSGIESKIIRNELKEAESGLYQLQEMGYYQNVKKVKTGAVTLNQKEDGVEALRSLFNFSARGNRLMSEIYLFGFENQFVKIRATRAKPTKETKNEAMSKFFDAMNELFSKSKSKEKSSQVASL